KYVGRLFQGVAHEKRKVLLTTGSCLQGSPVTRQSPVSVKHVFLCASVCVCVCVCLCVWNGCQAVLHSTAPVFLLLHSRVIIALSLSFTLSLSPFRSPLPFRSEE